MIAETVPEFIATSIVVGLFVLPECVGAGSVVKATGGGIC